MVHRRQWTGIIVLAARAWRNGRRPAGIRSVRHGGLVGLRGDVLRFPTSCPEAAARRSVDRARHVAFQDDPPPSTPECRVRYRGGREQSLCIGMARVTADVSLIAELDDAPEVHDRDPV